MKRVLILCTGNSCRSQMAEALWNELGRGQWEAHSAGSKPAGYVHPLAVRVMRESGADLSRHQSKSVQQYRDRPFDLVVTVCGNARDACPTWPGATAAFHWPFDDPADAGGTDEEKLVTFRRVRDEIRQRIADYLASPESALPAEPR